VHNLGKNITVGLCMEFCNKRIQSCKADCQQYPFSWYHTRYYITFVFFSYLTVCYSLQICTTTTSLFKRRDIDWNPTADKL